MKKVLIIAYYFPPRPYIGSQRPYRLAKYLREFGWQPIILTAQLPSKPPEGITVIETPYKDVVDLYKKKLGFNSEEGFHQQLDIPVVKNYNYSTPKGKIIKILKEIITFPDEQKGWYRYALESTYDLLSREKIDAMISTSLPVTSHVIARQLKRKYKIPWVADFRDLWTQNHYYNKFNVIKLFEKRLELKTLQNADALVTVSRPLAETLGKIHKNKNVFVITNGFDTDDFMHNIPKPANKFTITYTGTLYNGKRDPSVLFAVLSQLIRENKMNKDLVEIRFFGQQETWILHDIQKYDLNSVVSFYGCVPRSIALEKQKESQLLLLLLWNNKNEKGVYTGKIFEYLGAKRPILAIGGAGGVVEELLAETNAGKYVNEPAELSHYLLEYYREFITHGEVIYSGNSNVENYCYKKIAESYSHILHKIVS